MAFEESESGMRFDERSASLDDEREEPCEPWLRGITGKLICSSTADRDTWLKAREPYVGGSDTARLLGVNYEKVQAVTPEQIEAQRQKQRGQLMAEKLGLAEPFEGSERTDLSGMLEGSVIELARKLWGWDIVPAGWLVEDAECPRLAASLDAMLWNPWAREWSPVDVKISACTAQEDCKPLKSGAPSNAAFAQGIPLYYACQLQSQMACTGARHSSLLVLHHADAAGLKLRAYYQARHEAVVAKIRREANAFWADFDRIKAEGVAA